MAFFTIAMLATSLLTGCAQDLSRDQLAQTIGQPHDFPVFGNHAVYMGDEGGYRYVHVRDINGFWNFVGECDFKVPASQWPMEHPMPLTDDAAQWRNVEWMNGDAPQGIGQNAFLSITPASPLGVPAMQPVNPASRPASEMWTPPPPATLP